MKNIQLLCKNCNSIISVDNIDLKTKIAKCSNCNSIFNYKNEFEKINYDKIEQIYDLQAEFLSKLNIKKTQVNKNDNLKDIQILCKKCTSTISANNIDFDAKIAKCSNCNFIFNCKNELEKLNYNKPKFVEMPIGLQVNKDKYSLNIIKKWYSHKYITLAIFTVFWDSIIILIYIMAFLSKDYEMVLFGSLHALIGLYLTYTVLTGFINKTYIIVDSKTLKIKNGPIPSFGNKVLNLKVKEVQQIYIKKNTHYDKRHNPFYSYDLHAVTNSGDIKILSSLNNAEQALYIEQEIEKYLKIKDEYVKEEMKW